MLPSLQRKWDLTYEYQPLGPLSPSGQVFLSSVTFFRRKKGDPAGRPLRCAGCPASMLVAGARLRLQSTDYLDCTTSLLRFDVTRFLGPDALDENVHLATQLVIGSASRRFRTELFPAALGTVHLQFG